LLVLAMACPAQAQDAGLLQLNQKIVELHKQGKYKEATVVATQALEIAEKSLEAEHPAVANSLATMYRDQGRYAQVELLHRRALAIRGKALGVDHPDVALSLNNLGGLFRTQGRYAQALAYSRRAAAIYCQRIVAGGASDAAVREASKNQTGFFRHLTLHSRNPDKEPESTIADEALQVVQLAQASGTASAIAKMAARFAGAMMRWPRWSSASRTRRSA
jgi:tetratricopeptide (TPR) repeat protein